MKGREIPAFAGMTGGLAGCFPALEDELAGMTAIQGCQGPGRSPDRAGAMVWAVTAPARPPRAEPRVRRL